MGQQPHRETIMPRYHVASISSDMALVSGLWGGATTKLMLDSGSSVSLVKKDFVDSKPVKFTRLITNTLILSLHQETTFPLWIRWKPLLQ